MTYPNNQGITPYQDDPGEVTAYADELGANEAMIEGRIEGVPDNSDYAAETTPVSPAVDLSSLRVVVSLELILYVILLAFALLIRLPELNVIPLTDHEAHEALAVYRVITPGASGSTITANNPLMFTANMVAMSIGGTGNVAPRFATLLMGLAIVASPLLFRRWLGAAYTLILTALLAFSPVLLISSRSMSGAVWSLGLAVGFLWLLARYAQATLTNPSADGVIGTEPHRHNTLAIIATVVLVLLAVAAEPAGYLTLIALAVGFVTALIVSDDSREAAAVVPNEQTADIPPAHPDYRRFAGQILGRWPFIQAAPFVALAVVALTTVFLTYPSGMSTLGQSVGTGLRGFFNRPDGYPAFYPVLVSIMYEPFLWIFGLAGVYFVIREDHHQNPVRQFVGRVFLGWLIASVLLSLLYSGAEPGHALWLTAPLAGLAAFAIEKVLAPVRDPFWEVPLWGVLLHGVTVVAILFIAGINLIAVGRAVLSVPPAFVPELAQTDWMKMLMIALATLLLVITFFLVGSIWGSRGAWHGLGIGLLLFGTLYSFNIGWQGAIARVDDPREPYHTNPPTRNLNLLRQTLWRGSLRATGDPYAMEITVQLPPGMTDSGALGWSLREYVNTKFVESLGAEVHSPVVIAPYSEQPTTLGGAYVGQDYATFFSWDRGSMQYWDVLAWLYNRASRLPPIPSGRIIVYVRSDIYGLGKTNETPTFPGGQ